MNEHRLPESTADITRSVLAALADVIVDGLLVRDALHAILASHRVSLIDLPGAAMWLTTNRIVLVDEIAGSVTKSEVSSAGTADDGRTPDVDTDADEDDPGPAQDGFEVFVRRSWHDLLSAEEEVALGRRIDRGRLAEQMLERLAAVEDADAALVSDLRAQARDGRRAADEFALHNMRLVMKIASRYRGQCGPALEFEDLVQEGYLGLAHAITKWDPGRGFKFSTYGTWWIRQTISRALDDKARVIRLPVHYRDAVRVLGRAEVELSTPRSRPSDERLARHLGWPVKKVQEVRSHREAAVSLDAVLANRRVNLGAFVAAAVVSPEDVVVDLESRRVVRDVVRALEPRQRAIIERRFGLGGRKVETLEEIAVDFGVTRERIRQIEAKALKVLCARARPAGLFELLDLDPDEWDVRRQREQEAAAAASEEPDDGELSA